MATAYTDTDPYTNTDDSAVIGRALVDFALQGSFPEEHVSSRNVAPEHFAPALESLAAAKAKLESDIHLINQETASDVHSWVTNAKTLEDDINRSRALANEIVRRSEAPDVSGQTIREAEEKARFLRREATYNRQVHGALTSIKRVNDLLDQVEKARDHHRVLESLHLLEKAWSAMDDIPVSKSCRVMRILDMRAFELKSSVHHVFDRLWNSLVQVDTHRGRIEIHHSRQGEPMDLSEALVGLKAYKEVGQRMALLWHVVDDAVVGPRTSSDSTSLPAIKVDDSALYLDAHTDRSIPSLFSDLEQIMRYLSNQLPEELVQSLSLVMMPDLVPRLKTIWLDPVVPASLKDIDEFQGVLAVVGNFCDSLRQLNYNGFDELQDWVRNASRVWLDKCRETALDSVRLKLGRGLGDPKEVERVETQTVSRSEGAELAASGAPAAADDEDWGAAWDDSGHHAHQQGAEQNGAVDATRTTNAPTSEDDGSDAWGAWGEDDATGEQPAGTSTTAAAAQPVQDDDGADDWGAWGDDAAADEPLTLPSPQQTRTTRPAEQQTREMTLRETYKISSMPEPVLALISAILEDGAFLVHSEGNPVATAAAGLFGLPTFILAMFRAISPHYYALDTSGGGNMFLYNDATYLSERLADLAASWKGRHDLTTRAVNMLRLDNDIKTLKAFAARAYSAEMTTQRTIVRDLLGGAQNVLQQDGDTSEMAMQVDAATSRIRTVATTWSSILSKSAWCQAVGSLVDSLAAKIILDVMDLSGIGQDSAFNIASLIAKITQLDDLFPLGPNEVPTTSQYVQNWLRLQFLSEFLQSNLNEVKYLWMESDLSIYFTVDEVIDLIGLSFADSPRTRETTREIRHNPQPKA